MTQSCVNCSKWTVKAANYCHHCGVQLGTIFENTASGLAVEVLQPARTRSGSAGFFNSDAAKWLIVSIMPATLGAGLAWLNGYEPGFGAIVGTGFLVLAGSGLLLARWYFERPATSPAGPLLANAVTVTLHEPLASGWRTYLDQFQDASITLEDLRTVAQAVSLRANFSRESMVKAGLSQPKARKVQAEFLRLNYACALPNGKPGYCLTIRGRKLLDSLLSEKPTPSWLLASPVTANNS